MKALIEREIRTVAAARGPALAAGSLLRHSLIARGVPPWRQAYRPPEVTDEVGLIAVAKLCSEQRPVAPTCPRHAFGRLVQAVPSDHLLRPDPHVLGEQTLQATYTEPEPPGEIVNTEDPWLLRDPLDDLGHFPDGHRRGVVRRLRPGQQELFDGRRLNCGSRRRSANFVRPVRGCRMPRVPRGHLGDATLIATTLRWQPIRVAEADRCRVCSRRQARRHV